MRKYVLAGRDVNALSNSELLDVISRTVPKETREYVPRVESRIERYRKL